MALTIDERDRIVHMRGDKNNPMTAGHVCFKGLQADEDHHGPNRLLHPLKRQSDGSFQRIAVEQALDEISEKIRFLLDREGPDSISIFVGNGGIPNVAAYAMQFSFMKALNSPQIYSPLTIDQSAKVVAFERLGGWAAGTYDLSQSEAVLLFGMNPLVSHAAVGIITADPNRRLTQAKARGVKIIAIDPCKSETARHADLFLQPYPGQDAAIAAGLLRLILKEKWEDAGFCATNVGTERMESLRAAVDPFTPEYVERRAGLGEGQLRQVAKMFARDSRTGSAFGGTGPNMAAFSNLTQHLIECLNVICGRFRRPGDKMLVDVMSPDVPIYAEVIPPPRSWQALPPGRIRGVGALANERMTGTLPEEILTPGQGQIKCLICIGGNPAVSVPDQKRMVTALRSLDLLICVEPFMTATAKLSTYIFPPKMQYERPDLPPSIAGFPLFPDSWSQYAPAILAPPAGSEVIDDWYLFWAIAKRLSLKLSYVDKFDLDMANTPTSDELLAMRLNGSRVTLDELKGYPSGKVFDYTCIVQPARSGQDAKFDVMPSDVAKELKQFLETQFYPGRICSEGMEFTHLLSSRRNRDFYNSHGPQFASIRKRNPHNPAYLNPADLVQLGLMPGDKIEISSDLDKIEAIVEADVGVRRGVISMSHGWGGLPDDMELDPLERNCVNILIRCDRNTETINAMPRMSGIPVNIRRSVHDGDSVRKVAH